MPFVRTLVAIVVLAALFASAGLAQPPGTEAGTPSPTGSAAAIAPTEITVRPGDTLWDLARRHSTTVDGLRAANGLTSDALRPGTVLTLPDGSDANPETYTVDAGDTLYEIAGAFGLTVDDIIAFNDLEASVIRPGQVLVLAPDEDAPAEALEVVVAPGDSLWTIARRYDTTVASIAEANGLDPNGTLGLGARLVIPGRYGSADTDLGGAATPEITVEPGETLWSIARRHDTTVAALMNANALSDERVRAGQRLRIVAGADLGRAVAAAPAPEPSRAAGMVWPLGGAVTSYFGYRRLRIGGSNMHYGLDIDGRTGEPIVAATGGVVTYADWMGGYGLLVVIEVGDTEYYYAHASEVLVAPGQIVETGQPIARVGTTGRVTGSHLHFEIRVGGDPVDPLPILDAQAAR